ncbi:MAG: VPLPA-CTERM sorting domain-containing protein [Sneathiella sp.]
MMKKILAALAVMFITTTTAQAASVTFDFLSGSNASVGWTQGNLNYSSGGVDLSVKAGNYSGGNVQDTGWVRQYNGYGLTVWNGTGDNNHEIDGNRGNDVAIFSFSEDVYLESVTFNYNDNRDQFAYFFDNGDNGSLDLINSSLDANPTDTYQFLGALLKSGDLFGIGAIASNDDFKIASITVGTISAVPLPAALPLYGAGMAIIGFVGWRRKRKLAAAA